MSDDFESWLRDFGLQILHEGQGGTALTAGEMAEFALEHKILPATYQARDADGLARYLGRRLSKLNWQADCVHLDTIKVGRRVESVAREGGGNFERKAYVFSAADRSRPQ